MSWPPDSRGRGVIEYVGSVLRDFSRGSQNSLDVEPHSPSSAGCDSTPLLRNHGAASPYRIHRDSDGSIAREEARRRRLDRSSSGPASRFTSNNPLLNSSRPRRANTVFVPFLGAGSEAFSFPHYPDCAHCDRLLDAKAARWGTGLCDSCYDDCDKDCEACGQVMGIKAVKWGTSLCDDCYDNCEKTCQFCKQKLEFHQLHWQTGLCDNCYNKSDKNCRICKTELDKKQLHWGSGLCDPCYDASVKNCKVCSRKLAADQLHWQTGLCDVCYNHSEKDCKKCSAPLQFAELHWQSGLCDHCYERVRKTCQRCNCNLSLKQLCWSTDLCDDCYEKCRAGFGDNCKSCKASIKDEECKWGSGLCDSCWSQAAHECKLCSKRLVVDQVHWGTSLCNSCYDATEKICRQCGAGIALGCLGWGTGLCDTCYDNCETLCRLCDLAKPPQERKIALGSLHWGTGICDSCFDSCEKTCKTCTSKIPLGAFKWGTGLCNSCYDRCEKECRFCKIRIPFGMRHWGTGYCNDCYDEVVLVKKGLGLEVWVAILVQAVFYFAPALLQPLLFIEVVSMYDTPGEAAAPYAFILLSASVVSMAAPVPLGLWAERRGEREVYTGVTLIGGLAGLALTRISGLTLFALAWGLLNTPPAIRGVRAAHFAKNVRPENLSRAGQLASSAGLCGGIFGPICASLINRSIKALDSSVTGFHICAMLAMTAHLASAVALHLILPAHRTEKFRSDSLIVDERCLCECCRKPLTVEENRYRQSLCDGCYDGFGGEGVSFKVYKKNVLLSFCVVAGLLELSMNAGVQATFQPIVVTRLGWTSDDIAYLNVVSASLSVIVSLISAQLRLEESCQVVTAAAMYCAGVMFFTLPPEESWSCVVGLILGLKAQILFMAPFTSIFSRLIGRQRVTNRLTITLCLAPAVGGALGTVMSPILMPYCGTVWFMASSLPAVLALSFIVWFVKYGQHRGAEFRVGGW